MDLYWLKPISSCRYFVLTRDYLHCFKIASGSANERASDMGQFIFKVSGCPPKENLKKIVKDLQTQVSWKSFWVHIHSTLISPLWTPLLHKSVRQTFIFTAHCVKFYCRQREIYAQHYEQPMNLTCLRWRWFIVGARTHL